MSTESSTPPTSVTTNSSPSSPPTPTIAIAGAAGFVGSALADRLADRCRVLALGRRFSESDGTEGGTADGADSSAPGIEQRRCDLFSVRQTRKALEGAEVAVYLVHSMSPNARLTQGSFEDLDLLLADNFGRAASQAGVTRIIYLGGLVPNDAESEVSRHLASRLEVEKALGAHGVPVTALRAGLVVGEEGSSLNLLVRLVERLPLMICPSWTSSKTQPIALSDVIEILEYCCLDDETRGRVCEIGGPDVMSYREMMQATARVLGRRRPMIPVPLVTPALSELWVSLVTGTSRSLVRPLIQSLRHPMVADDRWLQKKMGLPGRPFDDALAECVARSRIWKRPIARSVQRGVLPAGRDVRWVGNEYTRWLERLLPGLLAVENEGDAVRILLRPVPRAMLEMVRRREAEGPGRYLLGVTGGLLAGEQPQGDPRLEFRRSPDGAHVLIALQDFEPRLPWWLYGWTQAYVHAAVMFAFRRHLAALHRSGTSAEMAEQTGTTVQN